MKFAEAQHRLAVTGSGLVALLFLSKYRTMPAPTALFISDLEWLIAELKDFSAEMDVVGLDEEGMKGVIRLFNVGFRSKWRIFKV